MPISNVGDIDPTGGNPVLDAAHEHVATARHGETVADVARRHGVEMRSLLEANPQLKDVYQTLNAGQKIRLPFDPVAPRPRLSAADLEQVQGGAQTESIAHKHLAGVKYEDIRSLLDDPTNKAFIQGKLSPASQQLSATNLAQLQGGALAVKGESADVKHKDEIAVSATNLGQAQDGAQQVTLADTAAKSEPEQRVSFDVVQGDKGLQAANVTAL